MIDRPNLDLELSEARMRALAEQALEGVLGHLDGLADQPTDATQGGAALSRRLFEPLPERGTASEALLDTLFGETIPCSFATNGPGYLAYIPGGGLFHSAVADLIANAVNRYVGVWLAAPGLVQLEANVVRWFCQIVGYPPEAFGILTTGGSMANFSAVVSARVDRLPENFIKGTLYVSDQVHHSVTKAAGLAGFPAGNVRIVPSRDDFSLDLDALEAALTRDRKTGWQPFMVVGSAGTTNTGAVDDLQALGQLARREGVWFHVDGAYGAFFMLTQRGRRALRGIEAADSITLDPHKGLFLPYGTGALLVRDPGPLRRAHASRADYMPAMQPEGDFPDFCELSPELTRDFRGLRVWFPLKLHGIQPFRDNLEEKLELAHWATEQLRALPGFQIVAEPQLSIVAFRLVKPGLDAEALGALNRELISRVNARGRVLISGTIVRGMQVARFCVLSFRTHKTHLEYALADVAAVAAELR